MTSPRPTDLNFALPPGFVPAARHIQPAAAARRTVEPPAPAPAIESSEPVAEPKPRAPRKPRAAATKAAAPKPTTPKPAAPRPAAPRPAAPKSTTRRRATPALQAVVEQEAGRILEDAARTAANMLAAARSTAARLGAELVVEHEQRRREMEDAVADLADYLDELAHRLRNGTAVGVG
jgi:cell division septum initiation protein DivIVA